MRYSHFRHVHLPLSLPSLDRSLTPISALQSLKEYYDDRHGSFPMPHELEMRIYHRLIHIRDTTRHDAVPPHIAKNPVFELVTRFRACVQETSKEGGGGIGKRTELKVDGRAMGVFGEFVGALKEFYSGRHSELGDANSSGSGSGRKTKRGERRARRVMYLVACVMEGVFGAGVVDDVQGIRGDLRVRDVIDAWDGPEEDDEEVEEVGNVQTNGDVQHEEYDENQEYADEDADGEMDEQQEQEQWNAFSQPPPATAAFPPPPSQSPFLQPPQPSQTLPQPPQTQTQTQPQTQQPIKSAFGNLSAFGGGGSAFGIVFPVSASSSTPTFPVSASSTSPATGASSGVASAFAGQSSPAGFPGQPQSQAVPTTTTTGMTGSVFGVPVSGSGFGGPTSTSVSGFNPPGLTAPSFPPPSALSQPQPQPQPQQVQQPRTSGLNPSAPAFTPPPPSTSNFFSSPSGNVLRQGSSKAGAFLVPGTKPAIYVASDMKGVIFPPPQTKAKRSLADAPPLGSGSLADAPPLESGDATGSGESLRATPTLPASAFSTPAQPQAQHQPQELQPQPTIPVLSEPEPHLVDRKQTLWDLPSTTPASIADLGSLVPPKVSLDTSNLGGSSSSYTPPPLGKPAPLTLPPTPTVRWFDPSSSNGIIKSPEASSNGFFKTPEPSTATSPLKQSSLALRKQSLGLKGLQIPGVPTSAEILSPLTLGGGTPRTGMPPPPPPSYFSNTQESPTPGASTSHLGPPLGGNISADSTPTMSPEKGKARATIEDESFDADAEPSYAEMKALARDFARRGSVVRRCFGVWKAKMEENVRWEEACRRSDAYRAKKALENGKTAKKRRASVPDALTTTASRRPEKRRRPRGSAQYVKPVTDEELVRRLKEVRVSLHYSFQLHSSYSFHSRRTKKSNNVDGLKGPSSHPCAHPSTDSLATNTHSTGRFGFHSTLKTMALPFGWNASSTCPSRAGGSQRACSLYLSILKTYRGIRWARRD